MERTSWYVQEYSSPSPSSISRTWNSSYPLEKKFIPTLLPGAKLLAQQGPTSTEVTLSSPCFPDGLTGWNHSEPVTIQPVTMQTQNLMSSQLQPAFPLIKLGVFLFTLGLLLCLPDMSDVTHATEWQKQPPGSVNCGERHSCWASYLGCLTRCPGKRLFSDKTDWNQVVDGDFTTLIASIATWINCPTDSKTSTIMHWIQSKGLCLSSASLDVIWY